MEMITGDTMTTARPNLYNTNKADIGSSSKFGGLHDEESHTLRGPHRIRLEKKQPSSFLQGFSREHCYRSFKDLTATGESNIPVNYDQRYSQNSTKIQKAIPPTVFEGRHALQVFEENDYRPTTVHQNLVNFDGLSSHQNKKSARRKIKRNISTVPWEDLSEPTLSDDFYLNLVSWFSSDIVAYGLGDKVRLWNVFSKTFTNLYPDTVQGGTMSSSSNTDFRLLVNATDPASATARHTPTQTPSMDTNPSYYGSHAHRHQHDAAVASMEANSYEPAIGADAAELQQGLNSPLVTAVASRSAPHSPCLAVGLRNGTIQLWDVERQTMIRKMKGHSDRISALAWNGMVLSSGSRDQIVASRDVRCDDLLFSHSEHCQEVCGLCWSADQKYLASGGNDNLVVVWDSSCRLEKFAKFDAHTAAVKALAWSPHKQSLLVSGGGTADRTLRFWNMQTCELIRSFDTGSQICNLAYSANVNEFVTTHGYSLNQIIIWQYPTLEKICALTGHSYRVLYLSLSPDGDSLVSGAGGEGLKFWKVFPQMANRVVSRYQSDLRINSDSDMNFF